MLLTKIKCNSLRVLQSSAALRHCGPFGRSGLKLQIRESTSSVVSNFKYVRIDDIAAARSLCGQLSSEERSRLAQALQDEDRPKAAEVAGSASVTYLQMRQLFVFNMLPFIGFGVLDNMLMIVAGEYIEHSLGFYFTISTMASAALGNMVSDVFGVGLAHYVELLVTKVGIKQPVLTAAQLESRSARFSVNLARACGLVIGCTIGMFPLLFLDCK